MSRELERKHYELEERFEALKMIITEMIDDFNNLKREKGDYGERLEFGADLGGQLEWWSKQLRELK